jgi:hypothetical protein
MWQRVYTVPRGPTRDRMVRMVAAALVEVGHGRLQSSDIAELLESGDRCMHHRMPDDSLLLCCGCSDVAAGWFMSPRTSIAALIHELLTH